jgi:hypothetical protein
MSVLEIILRAQACCARVPDRNISERTRQSYAQEFSRMWREGCLDPLRDDIARDTYNYRRAALLTGSKLFLESLIANCIGAGERRDVAAVMEHTGELLRAVKTIERAFELEPPLPAGVSLSTLRRRGGVSPLAQIASEARTARSTASVICPMPGKPAFGKRHPKPGATCSPSPCI